jgi:hypothetical protein
MIDGSASHFFRPSKAFAGSFALLEVICFSSASDTEGQPFLKA